MSSLVKNSILNCPMHFQTSTGNSSGPTALPFFILLSAFFSSTLLTQFTFLLTTSAFFFLGSRSFFSFISFPKYFFQLFNTACEHIITLPFLFIITFTRWTSFIALSLCLANLYNFFPPPFVYNLAYKSSYAPPFPIATAFFDILFFSLYIFLVFSSFILSHTFCASFFYALLYFLIPPPCFPISFSFLKCYPQHSLSCFS